jgi:antitoxin component YwqK of YwqJK toxin-antitoxin module
MKDAPKTAKPEPHEVRHKNGSLWAKGKVLNGLPDGPWEWFRKDGTKMRAGIFKNGKQVGDWTTYDKTGRVVKVTTIKVS